MKWVFFVTSFWWALFGKPEVKKIKIKKKFEKVKYKKLEKGILYQIISKVWEMSTKKKKTNLLTNKDKY